MAIDLFNWFLGNPDYYISTGRGLSVYNAPASLVEELASGCAAVGVTVSVLRTSTNPELPPNDSDIVVIFQDLPYDDFFKRAPAIVDGLIFPLWYGRRPLCFLSALDKSDYLKKTITSGYIHTAYEDVLRFLSSEQLIKLLDRVNYQFSSPEFLRFEPSKVPFTPIEELMKDALERAQVSYEALVRIGGYHVDFLAAVGRRKVIVECDGRSYHHPDRDAERDQVLSREGHPILHFSGSEIFASADRCVEAVKRSAATTKHNYDLDPDLDDSQRAAQSYITGPVRVLAPAGSGKTKTLTNRILNLLNHEIDAGKILALAFNKKAADEMKTRLGNHGAGDVEVRTFHSFGNEVVRRALGWRFDHATEDKTRRDLLQKAVDQNIRLSFKRNRDPLDPFLDALRRTKMELRPIDGVQVDTGDQTLPFEEVFTSYLWLQTQHRFYTFDDMIYLAVRILLNDDALRHEYQDQFEYLLVDEFQDLNRAQLLLLQILALPENNLFVVGDDDQMIYGWRGAEVRHILDFPARFAVAQDCTLSTNYRSSKDIIRHSRWLIDFNKDRVRKDIQPRPGAKNGSVAIELREDTWDQAKVAAEWVSRVRKEKRLKWRDFAILFRYNAYQYPVALMLDSMKIPHSPVNLRHMFNSGVGRDIFAYATVILKPDDAEASDFRRVLRRPNKYLTNQLIDTAHDLASFRRLSQDYSLQPWLRTKLQQFVDTMHALASLAGAPGTTASSFLTSLDIEIGLRAFYRDQSRLHTELEDASDEVMLEVILSVAKNYPDLEAFYGEMHQAINNESIREATESGQSDEVILSTIHRTKGGEYGNVVYFNLSQDGRLATDSDTEEERRVSYVGITRAISNLLVTAPTDKPSKFLRELALNPEFRTKPDADLRRTLTGAHRDLAALSYQIQSKVDEREHLLTEYPELRGEFSSRSHSLWGRFMAWIREGKVRSSTEKLGRLDAEIEAAEAASSALKERQRNIQAELDMRARLPRT
ncbi:MAG: UvrD-helicase domain-containing protein [Actinobacteria bacterium]|nr:UvrD-helicase domain-containing protein [Actinomycetota bacterium]